MAFRRYSRPRKFSRRPRRSYRRKSTVSKKVKSYVKRAIHRNIENKENIEYAANQTVLTGSSGGFYSINLINDLAQGSTNSTRVGNQIKVVKGLLSLSMNLLKYNATTNPNLAPMWVKIWIVRCLAQAEQDVSLPFGNEFFKVNNDNIDFQGNTLDMHLPVNTDKFRVLTTRMFKLGSANVNQPNAAAGSVTVAHYADNSPFAKKININWGRYVRKQLKYTDTVANCMNDNCYMVIQVVPCDGTSNSEKESAEIHYVNTMCYEDA